MCVLFSDVTDGRLITGVLAFVESSEKAQYNIRSHLVQRSTFDRKNKNRIGQENHSIK